MKIEEMLQDYKDDHEIGRLDMFEELAYRYYQQAAELSALRAEVERLKALLDRAKYDVGYFAEAGEREDVQLLEEIVAALNAPSEGQKRE